MNALSWETRFAALVALRQDISFLWTLRRDSASRRDLKRAVKAFREIRGINRRPA